MANPLDRPAAQRELDALAAAITQMRTLSAWRVVRLWQLMGDVRGNVSRLMTLLRAKGSLWLDLQVALPALFLGLFQVQYLLSALGLLFAAIAGVLTVTSTESVVENVTQTVAKSRTESSWFFWTRTVNYTERVTVPVTVDRPVASAPADFVVWAVLIAVVVGAVYGVCWLLKQVWLWQADRNHRWLAGLVTRHAGPPSS